MAGKEISRVAGRGGVNNFISFFHLHLNEPSSDWGTSGEPGALPETTHSAKAKSQDPWPPAGAPNRGLRGGRQEEGPPL